MKNFGEPCAGMIVFSLLNNASYAIYQCEAKYIYLWMALWLDRKASKEAICSELADVRNGSFEVGGSEPFCPCLSLSLSASTSFQSCLAAAKTHKPVLTEANYSSLHLLQTGWNSSGVQHLCTQRHFYISLLLHIKTNWFTIKNHWAFEIAQSYEALPCHNLPKAANGQIYWRGTNQLIQVQEYVCVGVWIKSFLSCS